MNLTQALVLLEETPLCTIHPDEGFYVIADQEGNVLLAENEEVVKALFELLKVLGKGVVQTIPEV